MTGSGPVAAFLRFVLCGGGVTLLGSAALLLVGDRVPLAAANAVVTVATTVLATELHGRITFRRGRAGWRDHAASGLTVLLSYLFTTGALLAFTDLRPSAGALPRQAVYLAASGAAGIARFLLLRCVVFARRPQSAPPARTPVPEPAVEAAPLRVRVPVTASAVGDTLGREPGALGWERAAVLPVAAGTPYRARELLAGAAGGR